MGESVYISANLTSDQIRFLKLLDEYEVDIFSMESIESELDDGFKNLNEVLENLVDKGFLSRIERGKYCRATFRDEYVIGTFVVKKGAVAYWSALNLHGLTERFPNTVFIQSPHKKTNKVIFGIPYKFIKIPETKRAGIISMGYGNHSFEITDIEKTIVDCFDRLEYSGGYSELIQAFYATRLSSEKMIRYCQAINNRAAVKRMGLLAELFAKRGMKSFVHYVEGRVNEVYNLFDPQAANSGTFDRKWRVRMNISYQDILDIAGEMY